MIQNIPTDIINYIDDKSNLITNQIVNKIQINSEDDLSSLTACGVGTRAYLSDESKTWIYGADNEWHQTASSSAGGTSPLMVHGIWNLERTEFQLDKTWKEIYDAFISYGVIIEAQSYPDSEIDICNVMFTRSIEYEVPPIYSVAVLSPGSSYDLIYFYTNSENGYPIYSHL